MLSRMEVRPLTAAEAARGMAPPPLLRELVSALEAGQLRLNHGPQGTSLSPDELTILVQQGLQEEVAAAEAVAAAQEEAAAAEAALAAAVAAAAAAALPAADEGGDM
jgi:hypothetical protein